MAGRIYLALMVVRVGEPAMSLTGCSTWESESIFQLGSSVEQALALGVAGEMATGA